MALFIEFESGVFNLSAVSLHGPLNSTLIDTTRYHERWKHQSWHEDALQSCATQLYIATRHTLVAGVPDGYRRLASTTILTILLASRIYRIEEMQKIVENFHILEEVTKDEAWRNLRLQRIGIDRRTSEDEGGLISIVRRWNTWTQRSGWSLPLLARQVLTGVKPATMISISTVRKRFELSSKNAWRSWERDHVNLVRKHLTSSCSQVIGQGLWFKRLRLSEIVWSGFVDKELASITNTSILPPLASVELL